MNDHSKENLNLAAGLKGKALKGPHHRQGPRNVNEEHHQSLSLPEQVAIQITQRVGTMGFFFAILAWTVLWLGWNFLAPKSLQFDPPTAFVLWLFIANVIQIMLMPLIMVGQNLQGRHSELRAESDYELNVKAEVEIQTLFEQIKYQERTLQAIAAHLGITVDGTSTE